MLVCCSVACLQAFNCGSALQGTATPSLVAQMLPRRSVTSATNRATLPGVLSVTPSKHTYPHFFSSSSQRVPRRIRFVVLVLVRAELAPTNACYLVLFDLDRIFCALCWPNWVCVPVFTQSHIVHLLFHHSGASDGLRCYRSVRPLCFHTTPLTLSCIGV